MNTEEIDYEWLVKEIENDKDIDTPIYWKVRVKLGMQRELKNDDHEIAQNKKACDVLDILSGLSPKINDEWDIQRHWFR